MGSFGYFEIFGFFEFLLTFLDFLSDCFGFFLKLLRLLLSVTEVTTEHQKWPNISTNSVKSSFFAQSGEGGYRGLSDTFQI